MTRLEFKSELSRRLDAIPYNERQKPLDYYDEMICDRIEDGMSEEEAVAAMGDIDEIAAEILAGTPLVPEIPTEEPKKPEPDRKKWAIAGLLLLVSSPIWIPIVGAIAVGALCVAGIAVLSAITAALLLVTVIACGYAMVIAAVLSGIALIVHGAYIFATLSASSAMVEIGLGVLAIGVGILLVPLAMLMVALAKRIVNFIKTKLGALKLRRKKNEA